MDTVLPASELRARKKAERARKDEEYKANEIRFGLRSKLLLVFSILILAIAIAITFVATRSQTKSLLEEKAKQGEIILRGLTNSVRTRLLDSFAGQEVRISGLKTREDFLAFYQEEGISEAIFEDVDQVKNQPDVIYAYVLGKEGIVLAHTDPDIQAYSVNKFQSGVRSYFAAADQNAKPGELRTVTNEIIYKSGEKNDVREIEGLNFSGMIAFRKDATLADAVGEVHIGLSLESVNHEIFMTKVNLQLAGLIAILVGIFTAIAFAALLAGPIRKVIEGMQKVSRGDFTTDVSVATSDEVGMLSRTFNVMLKGMSILVSPEVAQVVLSGQDLLKGGQKRHVTVLFSDIRGFTTISESLTPHEVVLMLNGYLEIMTDIIIKYGGVVDKFVGDEIFAVFGAPFDHPLHPLAACATALEMGHRLAEHNNERIAEGKLPINIGIGLNTGDVISGAMGSTKRVDYTSIGDTVNLGARLEGTNKVYSTLVIISEFTQKAVADDVVVRELDLIRVKGKNEPVKIFELIALTATGNSKIQSYLSSLPGKKLT